MKNPVLIVLISAVALQSRPVFCQSGRMQMFAIESYPLELTEKKTTHLVFPFRIISVDRGSRQILAQKAQGTDNILQVKAAGAGIGPSNLTVVTADGQLYSFSVAYDPDPVQLSIEFAGQDIARAVLTGQTADQQKIRRLARAALNGQCRWQTNARGHSGMGLQIAGPFVGEDLMFFRVRLRNDSDIAYHLESLRFLIRDSSRARRSAIQEQQIEPVYVLADTTEIAARSEHEFVLAFGQFTIPRQKYLAVQASEKDGSRRLALRIAARKIARPTPLKE